METRTHPHLSMVSASTAEEDDDGQISIEIHQEEQPPEGSIHTIQLQSPGGSAHFVEGLVVTTTASHIPNSVRLDDYKSRFPLSLTVIKPNPFDRPVS